MNITQQDRQAIIDIQGMAGFRVIKYLAEQELKELESVRGLKANHEYPIEAQALGKKFAIETLEKFLTNLNILEQTPKETNKTYE